MLRETAEKIHREFIYPRLTSGDASEDREIAHERALYLMERYTENNPLVKALMKSLFQYPSPRLRSTVFGLNFPNPLGVAAGFDKNGRVYQTLGALGFGHIEVGTFTKLLYGGNPRPRIFADPQTSTLINRMGFPGEGTEKIVERLDEKVPHQRQRDYILGINIGASKPSFERGSQREDYGEAYSVARKYGDYVVANISSPNTEGVRALQDPEVLDPLLSEIDEHRKEEIPGNLDTPERPFLVKLSPDIDPFQLEEILDVLKAHQVDGVIMSNTSTDPEIRAQLHSKKMRDEPGGISGRPLTAKALRVSRTIYEKTKGQLPIIRAGGIMDVKDYWNAISYGGASLVQVYAALVSERTSTPALSYNFNKSIDGALKLRGLSSVHQLKGKQIPFNPFLW